MNKDLLSKLKWLILGAIVVVAIVLRFWQLGIVPASPDWDEVALGYNAYSIIHTAKDEYGAFLPIVMRSYDDYKPALYSYLTIPSIEIFGLNVWAVRLPSAVFGVLAVIAVYFLVQELFKKDSIALLGSFFFAISPWHLQFSRIAFESQVGLAFNIFGALLFVKSFKKGILLPFSLVCFIASMYTYQSEKVFVPLLLLTFLIIFRKSIFAIPKKYLILTVIVGLILTLPLATYLITDKNALARAKGVSVFADQTFLKDDAARLVIDQHNHDYVGLLFDNRRVIFAKEIISNYLSHFDFNWLFITGDISRHHAPEMGLLYLWEVPFVLLGIYFLVFGEFSITTKLFIVSWFLIAPIPASVTTGVPHAVRAMNFLPIYQILTVLGVLGILGFLKKKRILFYGSLVILVTIGLFNFAYYLDQYFVQTNYYTAYDWQYGYAKAVPYIQSIESRYQKIVVSNQPPLDQSYMFFLFYLQYPPALYQQQSAHASGGFRENHTFGKYEFRPINWNQEIKSEDILYVGRPGDFPGSAKKIKEIDYPNGQGAIDIVE